MNKNVTLKGLPKLCECGGKMSYEIAFNMIWSWCKSCTPVVTVIIKGNK